MLYVALVFSLVFLCPAGGPSYLRNDGSVTGASGACSRRIRFDQQCRKPHYPAIHLFPGTVDGIIIACLLSGILSSAGMAGQNHKAIKKSTPRMLAAFVALLGAGFLVVVTSPFPRPSRI